MNTIGKLKYIVLKKCTKEQESQYVGFVYAENITDAQRQIKNIKKTHLVTAGFGSSLLIYKTDKAGRDDGKNTVPDNWDTPENQMF